MRFTVLADPATHTVFLVENEGQTFRRSSTANLRTALYAVDLLAGRVRDATDLAAWYGGAVFSLETNVFLVPAPAAPESVTARMTGGSVDVTWSPVSAATHYVIEGGTAPGLGNLGAVTLGQPSFSVTGVPPGRYYVRVRAVGVGGQGPRSADVEVVVP